MFNHLKSYFYIKIYSIIIQKYMYNNEYMYKKKVVKIEYVFLAIALGLFFFIVCVKSYTLGLKHGKQLGNNNIPTVNLNPIKAYKEHKEAEEEKKEIDKFTEGWQNIFSYTGDPQKEGE